MHRRSPIATWLGGGPLPAGALEAVHGALLPGRRQQQRRQVRHQQHRRAPVGPVLRRRRRRQQAVRKASQLPSGFQRELEIAPHPLPAAADAKLSARALQG